MVTGLVFFDGQAGPCGNIIDSLSLTGWPLHLHSKWSAAASKSDGLCFGNG